MTRYTDEQDAERLDLCGVPIALGGGDICYFTCDVDTLALLVAKGYADPRQTQNDSPTVADLLEYGQERKGWDIRYECYVVSNDRTDRRVSVEGVTLGVEDPTAQVEFLEHWSGQNADELTRSRVWWD